MKITKKFIKENPEMKLKELCPELFETKLEVGKWYKSTKSNALCFVEELFKNDFKGYGFDYTGEWINYSKDWTISHNTWKPATPEEIKNALEKEAVKRYPSGCIVKDLFGEVKKIYDERWYDYYFNENYFYFCGLKMFQNGTWATIIKPNQMTKQEAEEKFNIEIV